MHSKYFNFTGGEVEICFDADANAVFAKNEQPCIWLTDAKLPALYPDFFKDKKCITLPAGESFKTQATVDEVIRQLLHLEVDKKHVLVGIGGGITTDITGYAAAIYKRGISCNFIPTSILAMVDAAIGGKNGVNVEGYKNMVGTIWQPQKIIYDFRFLQSLPKSEWINGFAEIIKHACIQDEDLFHRLENKSIDYFRQHPREMARLIEENVAIKTNVVLTDEQEKADRMLLNFGHSFGHAIEFASGIPHGSAISIGMRMAAELSEKLNHLNPTATAKIKNLLLQYELPTHLTLDKEKVWQAFLSDKKRSGTDMQFVLLNAIGDAQVFPIALTTLKKIWDEVL